MFYKIDKIIKSNCFKLKTKTDRLYGYCQHYGNVVGGVKPVNNLVADDGYLNAKIT